MTTRKSTTKTTTEAETIERLSISDFYDSITGHEGRSVITHFDGVSIDEMVLRFTEGRLEASGVVVLVQQLEFVHQLREGKGGAEAALKRVLDLSRGQVLDLLQAYTADSEDDEPMPEEPVTEAGKGDSSTD